VNSAVLLLLLLDFVLITATPRLFFRAGVLNLRWWLTALPIGLCPLFIVACLIAKVGPTVPAGWLTATGLVAVVLFTASVAMVALTIGTHRVPIALWHQPDDDPQHIVTWGAYQKVRHPFYLAYLLAFGGALLAFPHWGTLAAFVYTAAMLNSLAAKEEGKLSRSEFGDEYRDYITRTGRFLPLGTGMRRVERERESVS
jgi:protein-S-isoprenylcysteine O-methyltransferase Ste14